MCLILLFAVVLLAGQVGGLIAFWCQRKCVFWLPRGGNQTTSSHVQVRRGRQLTKDFRCHSRKKICVGPGKKLLV